MYSRFYKVESKSFCGVSKTLLQNGDKYKNEGIQPNTQLSSRAMEKGLILLYIFPMPVRYCYLYYIVLGCIVLYYIKKYSGFCPGGSWTASLSL